MDARLQIVRSAGRPYASNIESATVDGSRVTVETSLHNDDDVEGMYEAICNVFAEAVHGTEIERVQVFGPGGGFEACDPF